MDFLTATAKKGMTKETTMVMTRRRNRSISTIGY